MWLDKINIARKLLRNDKNVPRSNRHFLPTPTINKAEGMSLGPRVMVGEAWEESG